MQKTSLTAHAAASISNSILVENNLLLLKTNAFPAPQIESAPNL
jgi:hypothetical protein